MMSNDGEIWLFSIFERFEIDTPVASLTWASVRSSARRISLSRAPICFPVAPP